MYTSNRRRIGALLPLVLLGLAPSQAASTDEARREHEAHEHGAAELHVIVEGKALHMELRVPAMNVVGFEHEPHDDEQRRAIAAVEETLERADAVFAPAPEAGCRVVHAHAGIEAFEHEHEKGAKERDDTAKHAEQEAKEHHDDKEEGGHSEVHAEYELECASPERLAEITIRLFELYPGIQRIDAEIIGSGGQSAATLTAANPVVQMPR